MGTMGEILGIIATLGAVSAIVYGFVKYLHEITQRKTKEREEYLNSFNMIVSNLTSNNKTSQLSAAILLRRYLQDTTGSTNLNSEAINVMSSLARVLPTSVFQKTLVDGLAYGKDLSGFDFTKTNLQDAYLGCKKGEILMNTTELYLADLSYALLENIVGHGIIFYRSILLGAKIKNCDFTDGNFVGADLTNVVFTDVILKNANFKGAFNVPEAISSKLVDGKYPDGERVTAKHSSTGKSIFFSMPGKTAPNAEMITNEYRRLLSSKGYDVIYYYRDLYPSYGQFSRVREDIIRSVGMVAFGLKQVNIHSATYRPETEEKAEWNNKWLSTPWSDIEVGMGLMKGMPILLVVDPDIDYGIFDNALSECYVATIPSTYDSKELEKNSQLKEWLSKL